MVYVKNRDLLLGYISEIRDSVIGLQNMTNEEVFSILEFLDHIALTIAKAKQDCFSP